MTSVTLSSVVELCFSLTSITQLNPGLCRPQRWSSLHFSVVVLRRGAVNRENSMTRQRYSFYKSTEVSFFGWMQIPSHSSAALWQQQASSGRVSGWACRALQAMTGDLFLLVCVRGEPWENHWFANVGETTHFNIIKKKTWSDSPNKHVVMFGRKVKVL